MKDSKVIIKGAWTTHIEYELRVARKENPYCYSAFPCDEHGNLIMKEADRWWKDFLYVTQSDDYDRPYVAKRDYTRKEPDLILCGCGNTYLGVANSHGQIICPKCSMIHGVKKERKARTAKADRKGFYIVRKESCA